MSKNKLSKFKDFISLVNPNNKRTDIVEGDYVKIINFVGLTDRQIQFLKAKDTFFVNSVIDKDGRDFIDIGYAIPFKASRFIKITFDKKFLFLQFNLTIDTHGEPDTQNFFQGSPDMRTLFTKLINDRVPGSLVEFYSYTDIYRLGNNYFINNTDLADYNFVFFGFAKKHSNIPYYIQKYLKTVNVPFLTYESYNLYDDKMYGLDIVTDLGYDYIPTIQTSNINKRILKHVREDFGYPVIVKITSMDQGKGVFKVADEDALIKFYNSNYQRPTMIQKLIPNDGDCRVILIKNKVELVVKRQMTNPDEFRSNVALGGKAIKTTLPQSVLDMCADISKHVECDIVGFDILRDLETGKYYVMEINVSPHMSTFIVVTGINLTGIIADYIVKNMKETKKETDPQVIKESVESLDDDTNKMLRLFHKKAFKLKKEDISEITQLLTGHGDHYYGFSYHEDGIKFNIYYNDGSECFCVERDGDESSIHEISYGEFD